MDRRDADSRVGAFLGALSAYQLTGGESRLRRSDPAFKAAEREVYALIDAGFRRDDVIGNVNSQIDLRQGETPYKNPRFRDVAGAVIAHAYRTAKTVAMRSERVPREDVIGAQVERAGNGFLEYVRRAGERDPDFDDSARQCLDDNIIDAVRVMTKHGLGEAKVRERIKDYLGEKWDVLDKRLFTRLIREGVDEQIEAEILSG